MQLQPTSVPDLLIVKNFLPKALHDAFVRQVRRGTPEKNDGHYDGFDFPDYEAFDSAYLPLIAYTLRHFQTLNLFTQVPQLGCSIVGYTAKGYIKRHVDSEGLSGDTVAVLSFGSPIVIHFYSEKETPPQHKRILVEPRDLYIMAKRSRYEWSHEILSTQERIENKPIPRGNRYSLLLFEPGPIFQGEIIRNNPDAMMA